MPDVFISYAHDDNQYPRYEAKGWVDCFYDALSARLNGIRPGTTIWRDQSEARITGNSILTPTIMQGLDEAAALVLIVSPVYATRPWCRDELAHFCDNAKRFGGLEVGTISRVLKVVKLPTEQFRTGIPQIDDATGCLFYKPGKGGRPMEFDPPHGSNAGNEFCNEINNVAYDLKALLDACAPPRNSIPAAPSNAGKVLYLADTSSDLRDQRERVRQELEQFGHTVLPQRQHSAAPDFSDGPEYADRVRAELAKATYSVHLIGDWYGPIPSRSKTSIVEMQYDIAGEQQKSAPNFARVLWMKPGAQPAEPSQEAFATAIKDDAELHISSIEDFKSQLFDRLARKPAPAPEADLRMVYLIFEKNDEQASRPLSKWLHNQGFEVLRQIDGDPEIHKHHISASDGVVIWYGSATEQWLEYKLIDLEKVYGAKRSFRERGCVVLADPSTDDKREFRSHLVTVVPGFGEFSPAALKQFLERIKTIEAGAV